VLQRKGRPLSERADVRLILLLLAVQERLAAARADAKIQAVAVALVLLAVLTFGRGLHLPNASL
jgi:hypothetical protein